MYEKTKKEIYNLIKLNTESIDWKTPEIVTTGEISRQLNISRNLCSHYLNDMVKEGELIKISTRPVSFLHRKTVERLYGTHLKENEFLSFCDLRKCLGISNKDVFDSYIGAYSGLSYQINKCKVSVGYPDKGIPILIYGKKGTGKHKLAELVGEYALDKGYSDEKTQFMDAGILGNQDEIFELTDCLEGKKKKIICIENVEKISNIQLMRILEKNECKIILTANIRHDASEVEQLVKQIPISIEIPSLSERSDEDKKELLLHFMKQEALKIKSDIFIDVRAMELLIQYYYARNIDELRDIVMTCCANAFVRKTETEEIQICIYDLPEKVLAESYRFNAEMEASVMMNIKNYKVNHYIDEFQNYCKQIYEKYLQMEKTLDIEDKVEALWKITEEFCDYLTYKNCYSNKKIEALKKVVSGMMDSMVERYGISFSPEFDLILAKCLYVQSELMGREKNYYENDLKRCLEELLEKYEVEQLLMEELKDNIESCLGVNASNMNQLFVLLNLIQFNRAPGWGKTRGMIICHGSATASSIAEIVNKVLGFRIFEAIDMPINVSPTEIIQRLKKYMKYIKKPRELIILVDMGSLEEMYSCLSDVKGLKAIIINNVSTRMAMDAGAKIRSSISLDKIAETVCCENRSTYRLVDNTIPQKAILFCSETGIGAAKRMSEMFAASFPKKLNIEFLSVDYKNVLEPKSLQIILDKYEVLFVVGTQDPQNPNICYVSMEDVIGFNHMERVFSVLEQFLSSEELIVFKENLVREFSLQNVIQNLTILEAEVLIGMVNDGIEKLQKKMGKNFSDRIRISLNVHICCLVERLIRKETLDTLDNKKLETEEFTLFANAVRDSFQNISLRYNVTIPLSEIAYIKNYFDYGKEKK